MTRFVNKSGRLPLLLVAAGAVAIAGCGGSSSPSVVSSSSLTPSQSTSSSAAAPSTSAAAPSTSPAASGGQTISISPNTGLATGTTVHVTGAGFTPNSPLVVNECADKGTSTGPGDCNLEGMVATTADATGKVSVDYVVTAGPFGANNIVCGAAQQCLLSISQAVPSPTEEASVSLTFK
jgi:hypothetical protein